MTTELNTVEHGRTIFYKGQREHSNEAVIFWLLKERKGEPYNAYGVVTHLRKVVQKKIVTKLGKKQQLSIKKMQRT